MVKLNALSLNKLRKSLHRLSDKCYQHIISHPHIHLLHWKFIFFFLFGVIRNNTTEMILYIFWVHTCKHTLTLLLGIHLEIEQDFEVIRTCMFNFSLYCLTHSQNSFAKLQPPLQSFYCSWTHQHFILSIALIIASLAGMQLCIIMILLYAS